LISWLVQVGEKLHQQQQQQQGNNQGGVTHTGRKKPTTTTKKKAQASSSSSSQDFNWLETIPQILQVFVKFLRTIKTERIWQTSQSRDELISNCFLKPTTNLLTEVEPYLKDLTIKQGFFRVLCLAAKSHGQSFQVQMTVMQNLQYHEHLSEPMAELLTVYSKEFDTDQLGEKVLGEIADKNFSSQDTKGPRSFSKFLIRLCEISPRLVSKQIVLLQKHLDSESYPMRNSILEILSILIKELSLSDPSTLSDHMDETKIKKSLEQFFGLLFERFLDLNSYVRSKVANLLIKTCDLPVRFPHLRLELTRLTIRSLHDKSSSVRKNCLSLLTKLILTHPYGRMHGGELELSVWEKRLEGLEQELKVLDLPDEGEREARKLMMMTQDNDDQEEEEEQEKEQAEEEEEEEEEESSDGEGTPKKKRAPLQPKNKNLEKLKVKGGKGPRRSELDLAAQTQHDLLAKVDSQTLERLRLTKKYYQDAISFIEQIEGSIDTVTELLASSVKSEVLEAMEFCKTAKEYKIEAAEQGVRRMLHLIWSKDDPTATATSSTTEEGGGGDEGNGGGNQKEVKGIRSRLIECYSSLYFEPPQDLPRKDQIAFVARNVIELTRDATLAELTSLEALLAVMMSRNVVDDEVINKLWQVYSKSLSLSLFPFHTLTRAEFIVSLSLS
jgi:condensin complex subunit 1